MKYAVILALLALAGCGQLATPTFTQAQYADLVRACTANGGIIDSQYSTTVNGRPYVLSCKASRP